MTISTVKTTVQSALSNPTLVFIFIVLASLFALGFALTSEYAFGLKPCILCLYQRTPYVLASLIGLLGFILARGTNKPGLAISLTGFTALIYFFESGLAFYHVGVEQHWWASAFEACKVSFDDDSSKSLLDAIMNTPAVRCDEIPWQMFGVSMAGYNSMMSFGLGVITTAATFIQKQARRA